MTEESKELLKRIWLHFVDAREECKEEKEELLDLFLCQFIFLEAAGEKPSCSELIDWSSVGNQLVHWFMSDIHEICSQQMQTMNKNNQNSETFVDGNVGVIEQLHHYILEKRGWKLLYALNSVGLEGVTCTKEVINLFTSLFPICLQLPVDLTHNSDSLQTNKEIGNIEDYFYLKKRPKQLTLHSSWRLNTVKRFRQRHYKSNLKSLSKKTDKADSVSKKSDKVDSFSNSDGEEQINSHCFIKSLKHVIQSNSDDFIAHNRVGTCSNTDISLVMKENVTFIESVSLMTICTCMIEILLQISSLEQQNSQRSSLVPSELILTFALETLDSFQVGRSNTKHWPVDDVTNIKRSLLRIIAATLFTEMKTKHCTNIIHLFSSFLITANAAISELNEKHCTVNETENIFFYSETIMVALFWILKSTEFPPNNETASQVVQIIRTFSSNGGLMMCCHFISHLESQQLLSKLKLQIVSRIVDVAKDVVISLKMFRYALSLPVWYKDVRLQSRCSELPDHHSDMLGLSSSHSVLNKSPLCCIATMSGLLLNILEIVELESFQIVIIRALKKCGICCCLSFNKTISSLLLKMLNCSRNVQAAIFILLEKTIIKQFGLTSYNLNICCDICTQRNIYPEDTNKPNAEDHSDCSSHRISEDICSVFKFYYEQLTLNSPLADIIGQSLLNLILIGHDHLKRVLFMQVVFPSLILLSKLSTTSSPEDILAPLQFCMVSLPPLLQSRIISEIFIKNEGLHYLCNLFEFPTLRNIALSSLKILILSQSEKCSHMFPNGQPSCYCGYEEALQLFENLFIHVTSDLCFDKGDALVVTKNKDESTYLSHVTSDKGISGCELEFLSSEKNVICLIPKLQICLENETGMAFICHLWSTCSELICKLPAFREIMSHHRRANLVCQFFGIVFNKLYDITRMSKNWRNATKKLLQFILTVYIDLSSTDGKMHEVYQILREHLQNSHPEKVQGLHDVFEVLFECMTHTCERQRTFKGRNYEKFPHYEEEGGFLSDSSVEIDTEDEGYDGDKEIDHLHHGDTALFCRREEKLPICNKYLCGIILDFMTFCNDKCCFQNTEWLLTLTYATKQFGHLCHQAFENRVVMHEQGLLKKIFTTLKSIFTSCLREHEELQRNIMDLFVLVGHHSVRNTELELFIEFFKNPSPPMGILLNGVNELIDRFPCMPSAYLTFPMHQDTCPIDKSVAFDDDDKNDPLQYRYIMYKCNSDLDLCAWKLSAIFLPLREDGLWHPIQNGFSVSLWIAFGHPFANIDRVQNSEQWKTEKASSCELSWDGPKELKSKSSKNVCHILSVGTELMFEVWFEFICGELIFRITHADDNGVYSCLQEASFADLIEPHRWLHVGISYKENTKKDGIFGEVAVIVDGYKETKFLINYSHFSNKCLHSCLLLGHSGKDNLPNNSGNIYYIGNVMVFQDNVLTKEKCYYLSQLGPDIRSLTECCLESRPMFFCNNLSPDMLESGIGIEVLTCLRIPCLTSLQEKLLAIYCPEDPSTLIVYPNVFSTVISLLAPLPNFQSSFKVITNDQRPSQQQPINKQISIKPNVVSASALNHTIQSIGGIRVLIFLFGRVVECSRDEESHAIAFKLILSMLQKDAKSYTAFQEIEGMKLISRILKDEKCVTSYYMLQVFLRACLSSSVLHINTKKTATVDRNSQAVIVNPCLFEAMLSNWKIWEKSDSGVMDVLFIILQLLVRDRHPYQSYNLSQMLSIHIMDILINILEEKFVNMDKSYLSQEMAAIIPWLIRKLLGTPPNVQFLKSVFDCMLLLHPSSRSYICHAHSSFYFLFSKIGTGGKRISQAESRSDSSMQSCETDFSKHVKCKMNDSILQEDMRRHEKQKHEDPYLSGNEEISSVITSASDELSTNNKCHYEIDTVSKSFNQENKVNTEYDNLKDRDGERSNDGDLEDNDAVMCYNEKIISEFVKKGEQYLKQYTSNPFIPDESPDKTKSYYKHETENEKISSSCHTSTDALSSNNEKCPISPLQILEESGFTLFTGLINILRETIVTCPDNILKDVINIVRPEALIVFAYHPCSLVTCAAVMALDAYLQRVSVEDVNRFLKMKGFHMLANQLHQFPATPEILDAILTIIAEHPSKLEEKEIDFGSPLDLNPVQLMACIPLLALIPNTFHDIVLCHNVMSALHQLLSEIQNAHKILLENGLVESLGKLLSKIAHSRSNPVDIDGENEEDLIYEDVCRIIHIITIELMSGSGANNFHMLLNLLHLFSALESFSYELCAIPCSCAAVFRSCQCAAFTAASDYIIMCSCGTLKEGHSANRAKSVSSETAHSDSMLDILANLPEMMNPYPFHLESFSAQSHQQDTSLYHLLGFRSKLSGYKQKLSQNLTYMEIVDRFRQILIKSVDFIVYKDDNSPWSKHEQEFTQYLLHITLKGMEATLEKRKGIQKSPWSSMMSSSLKETVRVQFGRLLISVLSPRGPIDQKIGTIRMLLAQKNCVVLLNYMFQTTFHNISRVAAVVHNILYNCSHEMTENDKKEIASFAKILTRCKVKIPEKFEADDLVEETLLAIEKETKEGYKKWHFAKESMENSVLYQYDALVKNISENATKSTRIIVDAQNVERKKFMLQIKMSLNERLQAQKEWCHLVEQMTHERAVWHMSDYYPQNWEMDPTEGPLRVRRRLRRCYLNIEPRFLLPEYRGKLNHHDSLPLNYLCEMTSQTDETAALIDKLHTDDKISYNCCCQIISSSVETRGEILIGDKSLHFVEEKSATKKGDTDSKCQAWFLEDIREVLLRRYELQDNALEIFLSNGLTLLVAFHSHSQREEFCTHLMHCSQLCLIAKTNLSSLTTQWRERSITNFEYLTQLNKIAGRSFNDLMQYPVFPFVLSDYSSPVLNLCDMASYRNFSKPIAIQNKAREKHYIDSYNCLKAEFDSSLNPDLPLPITGPYHYGSHYSNSGTVLHFLVRLLPFTKMFLSYQDNNFDIPDRTFHSLNTSWRLSSGDSTSDVKELIPEFFFLPEFLINSEGFNFGTRQTGEKVHHVALPPWCQNDPRLFILINRQALESDIVTSELQNWIDLVFGYKQTGKAAVEAINVFHPATYYGHDISKIEERLSREALEATIRTVGQTPRQLFCSPHPMVELSVTLGTEQQEHIPSVLPSVKGIKWGTFVGSPSSPEPILAWKRHYPTSICKLLPLLTNDVFGLADRTTLLLSHNKDKARGVPSATYVMSTALISWGHCDGILRMKLQRDRPAIPLLQEHNDKITICSSIPDCQLLFIGYRSGIIDVYSLKFDSSKLKVHQTSICTHLYGHSDEINSIFICKTYTVVVTGSKDCSCIIWDLNRLQYVRSITDHPNPVEILSVSDTLGDIVSVSHQKKGSCLKVHTINGQLVGNIHCSSKITAVCYSSVQEGTAVNVIAAGFDNGTIKLWNSWNLNQVSEIKISKISLPVRSLTYSCDNHHLYAAYEQKIVAMWEIPCKDIKKSKFLTLV